MVLKEQEAGMVMLTGFSDEITDSFAAQLEQVRKSGLSFIELRSADGVNVSAFTKQKVQEVLALLKQFGVRVSSAGSPIGKISVLDPFEPHLELFVRTAENALELGTRFIRMFSFYLPKGEAPELYRDEVFRRTERLLEEAGRRGVVLLHENEKDIYGDMAERCVDLMREFFSDHYKAVFDFANFVECGQDTLEAFESLKPYVAYVHIKDAVRDTKRIVPAGCGDGHVKEILGRLMEQDYRGFLSLEPHLVDFGALKTLEQEARERKSSLSGIKAWELALDALKELLTDLRWEFC